MTQIKRKWDAFRQKQEEFSAAHPLKASLPFLCLTGVVMTSVILASSFTLCYRVDAQGQSLAFFQSEETYDVAVTQAEERASAILNTNYSLNQDLSVQTALAPRNSLETLPGVTDSIMEIIPELEHVYTLSVDGAVVGAAEDADTISQALTLVKEHYTTPETRSIRFDSQVNLRYQYLPAETGSSTAEELAAALLAESPRTFAYTTQEGDTLEGLTELFSMTPERLQELNPDQDLEPKEPEGTSGTESDTETDAAPVQTAADLRQDESEAEGEENGQAVPETRTPLEPGLELTIEQSCPLLVVSTVEEQTLTRETIPEIQTQPDDTMFVGEERIIQEGEAGEETVLARVVKRCGLPVASADLSAVTVTESTPLIVGAGTQPMPELADGCLFLWPVRGPITSDYGYRFIFGENNFHRGIDIAAAQGTAINAADAGTVIWAGPKGTYGNLVILAHSNGFYTYYGHCSKLLVTLGEEVTQGQPIAAVGSTGRSTGPHCHFEVRYQGSPIDPLLYLPGTNNAPVRPPVDITEPAEPEKPVKPAEPTPPVEPVQPTPPAEPAEPSTPPSPDPAEPAAPEEVPVSDAEPFSASVPGDTEFPAAP